MHSTATAQTSFLILSLKTSLRALLGGPLCPQQRLSRKPLFCPSFSFVSIREAIKLHQASGHLLRRDSDSFGLSIPLIRGAKNEPFNLKMGHFCKLSLEKSQSLVVSWPDGWWRQNCDSCFAKRERRPNENRCIWLDFCPRPRSASGPAKERFQTRN